MSVEHRWTEGNRLVLELVASIEQKGNGAIAIASIFNATDERGNLSIVVRGFALFGVTSPTGDALSLRAPDVQLPRGDIAAAREAARVMAARLHAVAVETGALWGEQPHEPAGTERAS